MILSLPNRWNCTILIGHQSGLLQPLAERTEHPSPFPFLDHLDHLAGS